MTIHTKTAQCTVRPSVRLPAVHYSRYMGYTLLNAGVINTRTYSMRAKGQNERFELLTAVLLKIQV